MSADQIKTTSFNVFEPFMGAEQDAESTYGDIKDSEEAKDFGKNQHDLETLIGEARTLMNAFHLP